MSKADEIFIEMCRDVLENGTSTEGEKVRPHWEDGTPAYTLKKFGVINRYDLQEEFPAVTLRKTFIKSAMDELLWIWQKKSNDVRDLKSHVWDEWAGEDHTIGKAYGYQLETKHETKGITIDGLNHAFPNIHLHTIGHIETAFSGERTAAFRIHGVGMEDIWQIDQVDYVIYQLKNTPFSRRIMTTIWNPADLSKMNLQPCAYSMTFNVTQGTDGKLVLNSILNQRSQDILAANAWNVAQYALLTMMLAQVCDMEAGEFIHVIADAHIYDRHIPIIKELIQRKPQKAPKVWLDREVKDFYDFTTDNLHIEDYEVGGPQIKDIPIAI